VKPVNILNAQLLDQIQDGIGLTQLKKMLLTAAVVNYASLNQIDSDASTDLVLMQVIMIQEKMILTPRSKQPRQIGQLKTAKLLPSKPPMRMT